VRQSRSNEHLRGLHMLDFKPSVFLGAKPRVQQDSETIQSGKTEETVAKYSSKLIHKKDEARLFSFFEEMRPFTGKNASFWPSPEHHKSIKKIFKIANEECGSKVLPEEGKQFLWRQSDVVFRKEVLPLGKMFLIARYDLNPQPPLFCCSRERWSPPALFSGWFYEEPEQGLFSSQSGFGIQLGNRDSCYYKYSWQVQIYSGKGEESKKRLTTLRDDLLTLTRMRHFHIFQQYLDWMLLENESWVIKQCPIPTHGTLAQFVVQGEAVRALCTKESLINLCDTLQEVGNYLKVKGLVSLNLSITPSSIGIQDNGTLPQNLPQKVYKAKVMLLTTSKEPVDTPPPTLAHSFIRILHFVLSHPRPEQDQDVTDFATVSASMLALVSQDQVVKIPFFGDKETEPKEEPLIFIKPYKNPSSTEQKNVLVARGP
jgi:hypothetical protein